MRKVDSPVSPALKVTLDRTNGIINEGMKSMTDNFKHTVSAIDSSSSTIREISKTQADRGNSFNQVIPSGWLFKYLQIP